jgi:hypothetical protein
MFYDILSSTFGNVWRLFTSVTIPSTDIPFSAFFLALMLIRFSLWLLGYVTGGGIRGEVYGKPSDARDKVRPYRRPFNNNSALGSGRKGIGSGTGLMRR